MLRSWIAGLFLIAAIPLAAGAEPSASVPANPAFRTIGVQVFDLDGAPAAGRHAHLIGLSRGSFRPADGGPALADWDFTTDAQGRFSVRLGEFNTSDDKAERPGWGTYAVIVDGAGKDAGAVSSQFIAAAKPEKPDEPPSDWEWGPTLSVPPQGLRLVLHAKKGLVLEGHVHDLAHPGRPLAGIAIYANNDLYAQSHTGSGGEIFTQSAVTDAHGAFTIRHIYPVKFYVGVGAPHGFRNGEPQHKGYWIKTKSHGRWKEEVRDEIRPGKKKTVRLDILATAEPSFVYHGRVVDEQKRPLAGAEVGFAISYHPKQTVTFEDDHSYPSTKTDAKGDYSLTLGTPWLRGITVDAKGYARASNWTQSDAPTVGPGRYDFTLHRKQ